MEKFPSPPTWVLGKYIREAYGESFDTPEIAPLTPLGKFWCLELFHGPTASFKGNKEKGRKKN